MGKSVREAILDELLRSLREEIRYDYLEGDSARLIHPESILYVGSASQVGDDARTSSLINYPAILVSSPKITIEPEGGVNSRDDWVYHWLVQICDKPLSTIESCMSEYWRWQEQIASYFNHRDVNSRINHPDADVWDVTTTMVTDIGAKGWETNRHYISGVIVSFFSRQVRDAWR